ncbi:MAG: lamin tail domain-containing protein [Fibrobacterales bacterium]
MINSTVGQLLLFSTFLHKSVISTIIILLALSGIVLADQVKDTKFAVGRGFYDAPFEEIITTNTTGAEIIYTLDGSDPKTSNSAIETGSDTVSITIDPNSTAHGRPLTPGVTLRAYAKDPTGQLEVTDVDVQTYLFLSSVVEQQTNWVQSWPRGNREGQHYSFSMDPDVISAAGGEQNLVEALSNIPSISLVLDIDDMFGHDNGIYSNAMQHHNTNDSHDKGYFFNNNTGHWENSGDWERYTSMELLNPLSDEEFQVHAGIRVRGGWSRRGSNPKHAFRLFFKSEYGDSKLNYPLFGDEGASKFDKIDFRTAQNYSWTFHGGNGDTGWNNTFLREVLNRDFQGDMGQLYTKSRYYHLYINGMYWGLYMSQERAQGDFAASYLGGEDDDYDVIKSTGESGHYTVHASAGDRKLYNTLFNQNSYSSLATYYKLLGLNPDRTNNPSYKKVLDPENIIDYILTVYYSGDFDGPISDFQSNSRINNLYALINKENPDGFKFLRHDGENTFIRHSYRNDGRNSDNRMNLGIINDSLYQNPQSLHQMLMQNLEYKTLFADRVNKHLRNNGTLTTSRVISLLNNRRSVVSNVIWAESQRWGDVNSDREHNPYLKQDWFNAAERLSSYIRDFSNGRSRTTYILEKLSDACWINRTPPPSIYINNQLFNSGYVDASTVTSIRIENEDADDEGSIVYTLDGSDPRIIGGDTLPSASIVWPADIVHLEDSIPMQQLPSTLKARVVNSNQRNCPLGNGNLKSAAQTWTALQEIHFLNPTPSGALAINEIHYNPFDSVVAANDTTDETDFQFIELKNTTAEPLNMTGVKFTQGVFYDFPDNTIIAPNGLYVIATSIPDFESRYGFKPHGWMKGELSKSGEPLVIKDWLGTIIDSVSYLDDSPWNAEADGEGLSLIRLEPTTGSNDPTNWTASKLFNGSPNEENSTTVAPSPLQDFKLSEIHYHPLDSILIDDDEYEFLEFYNTSDQELSLKDLRFTSGVNYWFPDITIKPDSFYVIASNATEFNARYGFAPHAEYTKGLSNSGESITLRDGLGNLISRVHYTDSLPWSPLADGDGNSLEIKVMADTTNTAFHGNWGPSIQIHGTPGALPEPPAPPSYTLIYKPGIKNIFGSLVVLSDTTEDEVTMTLEEGLIADTVLVLPHYGYSFDGWTGGSMQNPRVDTATENFTVVAKFLPLQMQVNYNALTGGTITGTALQTIPYLTTTTAVTAIADPHYTFAQWSDGLTTATRSDTALAMDTTITAEFTLNLYTVSINSSGNGTVLPTKDTTMVSGSPLALTATPNTHYHFTHWDVSEGLTVTQTELPATSLNPVLSSGTITGHFAADTYTVSYATQESKGTISGAPQQTITAFERTSAVTATPATGFHFVSWSDETIANPRSDSALYKDTTISANFVRNNYTLTIIRGSFDTIVQTVPHGSGLRMSTSSSPQYIFSGWTATKGITLSDPDSMLVNLTNITESATVTAHYTTPMFHVNYSASPGGSVTGEQNQLVNYGSSVSSVEALPDPGYIFTGWSDGLTDNPRTDVNISQVLNISALFELAPAVDPGVQDPTQPDDTVGGQLGDTLSTPVYEFGALKPLSLTLQKLYDSRTLITLGGDNIEGAELQVFTINGTMIATLSTEHDFYVLDNSSLSYELPTDAFAPGLYIVSAHTIMGDGSQKFISRQLRID